MVLSQLFLSFAVSRKYQFTFPNIQFAINCNNDMKKQNKLRQTKSRRTVENNVFKTLQETSCKAKKTLLKSTEDKSCFKHKGFSHQMLI